MSKDRTPEETKRERDRTEGIPDLPILGCGDRDGPDLRVVPESAETLTCLGLAYLWDDPENNNFDYPFDWRRGE